jgi:hypothetical protein
MAVIIPCAGRSSRFNGTRPKYLLTLFDGQFMFEKAAKPYIENNIVYFIILKEHDEKYGVQDAFNRVYKNHPNVKIIVLDNETTGPAETIYQVTKTLNDDEFIFIKDCDSFFDAELTKENHVCVADLRLNLSITKVAAKSFAVTNDQDMITNIIEKSVVSNYICVGGYAFKHVKNYNESYKKLKLNHTNGEIFVSHIIKEILNNCPFEIQRVENYEDVGTYEEFVNYNQLHPTIFCDLDGTVFYNQSKIFNNHYNNKPIPIESAVKFLLNKQEKNCKIVFCTSRPSEVKQITTDALNELGFNNYYILFDMPHSPRIIINDYSLTNPYPTAISINVPRDDNQYWQNNPPF